MADVVRMDKEFDYSVPDRWHRDGRAELLGVGSIVRIALGPRRVRGWVTAMDVDPVPGVKLRALAGLTGIGPPQELLDLAKWAGWRWAGHQVSFLRMASPERAVKRLPMHAGTGQNTASSRQQRRSPVDNRDGAADGFDDPFEGLTGIAVVQVGPADDMLWLARLAARRGDALIVVPTVRHASRIASGLRREGVRVAHAPRDWAQAAAGATVVGARVAAWMPMPHLAAVLVLDEHDESLKSEYSPAWHARDVAIERARRARVPVVLASAVPSLEARVAADHVQRAARRGGSGGWPTVEVLDRRREDPIRGGLFTEGLKDRLAGGGRVVAILNRRGRSRLLACNSCGELVRSSDQRVVMKLEDDELVAVDGSERRPVVCVSCGSTTLKNLRIGVTDARGRLEALMGEQVAEITANSKGSPTQRVVIGTEAALRRVSEARTVVFLDFDQELLALRQRAAEQALALLAQAARILRGRRAGGRLIIQTRQPEHPVIRSAVAGNPEILAELERDRRSDLGLPPFSAQVAVSGPGASTFIEALRTNAGPAATILGPLAGRYLLRSQTHNPLLNLLAATRRPPERLRIEVDPLRV